MNKKNLEPLERRDGASWGHLSQHVEAHWKRFLGGSQRSGRTQHGWLWVGMAGWAGSGGSKAWGGRHCEKQRWERPFRQRGWRARHTLLSHPHAWRPTRPQAGGQETAAEFTASERGLWEKQGWLIKAWLCHAPTYTHTAALWVGAAHTPRCHSSGCPPPSGPEELWPPTRESKSAPNESLGPGLGRHACPRSPSPHSHDALGDTVHWGSGCAGTGPAQGLGPVPVTHGHPEPYSPRQAPGSLRQGRYHVAGWRLGTDPCTQVS